MSKNSSKGVNSSDNSKPNSSPNSNLGSNLKAIFALPKWAKIFLAILTLIAAVGLGTAFSLKSWAVDKVDSGEIVLKGIDRGTQERLDSGFAYQNRLYFQRLDFLLRSKVIAYIDIQQISWSANIDKTAISEIISQNRHIKFTTSQDLISQNLNGKNLGKVEYKMDFSPLIATILKYYLIITLGFILAVFAYRLLVLTERGEIKFAQSSLPSALWQGYKGINPLYRHTFWIVFVAMNLVFGFHTINFLWGSDDWGSALGRYGIIEQIAMGRYTQNLITLTLQDGLMLPLLNNMLGFVGLALGAVWFCMYFNIQKRLWIWVSIGLLLTLQPFTLTRMYYAFQLAGLFVAVAIGILGFILAKKAGEFGTAKAQPDSLSLSLSLASKIPLKML